MKIKDFQTESWSEKYKNSINCSHPKGFSQRAHCAGKNKQNESVEMEMVCEDCGMCKSHGNLNEIAKGAKDANGYTRCWPGKHAEGTKKGKNGGQVRNCVPNESITESTQRVDSLVTDALKIMQGSEVTDAVQALKTVLGDREYNSRRGHYNFYVRQMMDMYGQQGVAEGFNGEYDDEAGMVKNNLHTIIRVLTHLGKDIDNNENFPEWVQEKIAMIKQTSVEVMNYMISQHEMDIDPEVEEMYEAMDQLAEEMAAKKGISADLVWESFEALDDHMLYETAAWRRKEGKSKKGGLNAKGVASYRRENPGSKLQTAVTTKPSKLKPGSKAAKRRKSFCARMSGVKGPAKKPNGEPTRKTLALRKWNC